MVGFASRFVKQGFQAPFSSVHSNNAPWPFLSASPKPIYNLEPEDGSHGLSLRVLSKHILIVRVPPSSTIPQEAMLRPLFPARVQRGPSEAARCASTKRQGPFVGDATLFLTDKNRPC